MITNSLQEICDLVAEMTRGGDAAHKKRELSKMHGKDTILESGCGKRNPASGERMLGI